MRLIIILLLLVLSNELLAQYEFSAGYAVNKNLADGVPIQAAYDIRIKNKLYTKTQLGFKYLFHFNDFVGATMRTYIWEFHQTI